MKKILLITLTALFAFMSMEGFAQSQRKKRAAIFTNPQNYDAQVIAVGTTGTKYIYVSGTGKKMEGALFQAQQNAIHPCIFKNIPGTPQAEGVPALYDSQEPKPEDEEFFDEFLGPCVAWLQVHDSSRDTRRGWKRHSFYCLVKPL